MYHHPTEGGEEAGPPCRPGPAGGHFRSFQTPQALGHFCALLGLPRPSVVFGPCLGLWWPFAGPLRARLRLHSFHFELIQLLLKIMFFLDLREGQPAISKVKSQVGRDLRVLKSTLPPPSLPPSLHPSSHPHSHPSLARDRVVPIRLRRAVLTDLLRSKPSVASQSGRLGPKLVWPIWVRPG